MTLRDCGFPDTEPGQPGRGQRDQAGDHSGGGEAGRLGQDGAGRGAGQGGRGLAGEEDRANPAEERVRDHPLHGGLRDH
jgi:hypothetical protein